MKKTTPAGPSVIDFVSGVVDAGAVYDTVGPGIAPPVVTLAPPHPGALDFDQASGGLLVSGDTNNILYSVAVYNTAQIILSLSVVGSAYHLTDITSVSFIGADSVAYHLGKADSFQTAVDSGDPTLVYGRWEWHNKVSVSAFADGVETVLTIAANFSFGN